MTLNGKRLGKFFADSKAGGKRAALEQAKAYRDVLQARRLSRTKRPPARTLVVIRGGAQYCQIRIPLKSGKSTTTEFSISRHGVRKARQLALAAYAAAQQSSK